MNKDKQMEKKKQTIFLMQTLSNSFVIIIRRKMHIFLAHIQWDTPHECILHVASDNTSADNDVLLRITFDIDFIVVYTINRSRLFYIVENYHWRLCD